MDGLLAALNRQILPSCTGQEISARQLLRYSANQCCTVSQKNNKKALGAGGKGPDALHYCLEHLRLRSANRAVIAVSLDGISTGFQDCAFQS
jgi:hypothetical protein